MSKKYNGHKNWAHWNVSLWINNDEGLYHLAPYCVRRGTRDEAARKLLAELPSETPDGAKYSLSSVRAALVGFV